MRPFVLLLILLALLTVAGSVTWTGRAADDLRQQLAKELDFPTRTTDVKVWNTATGLPFNDHVTTTQGEIDSEETRAQWNERHRHTVEEAVADLLANGYQATPPATGN